MSDSESAKPDKNDGDQNDENDEEEGSGGDSEIKTSSDSEQDEEEEKKEKEKEKKKEKKKKEKAEKKEKKAQEKADKKEEHEFSTEPEMAGAAEANPEMAAMDKAKEMGDKVKKKLMDYDKKMQKKIRKYKTQTKYKENLHYTILGVKLPTMLSNFFRSNTARFKILVRSLEVFPVEFAIHLVHDINPLGHMLFIGFLLIALWMAFEEIALYASRDVLLVILTVISEVSHWLKFVLAVALVFLLGPVLWCLQALVCGAEKIGIMREEKTIEGICDAMPEFWDVDFTELFDTSTVIPGFWDFMATSKTTCAEFSTGLEELQVMPKLILSPFICPILQHVRPVGWLHDFFWYTLAWGTWEQGIERTYEAPWAKAVTHQDMTNGVANNRKCEPPPNALFCFILGFGFLVVEIMVPVMILMLVIKPLKDAVGAILGIAISILYYSINFLLWLIEELTHVLEWAGRNFAWLVVLLVPLSITAPVGWQYYGEDGVFGGCAVGILLGLVVILEHTPDEQGLGGPSHNIIMGVSAAAVGLLATGGVLNRYI